MRLGEGLSGREANCRSLSGRGPGDSSLQCDASQVDRSDELDCDMMNRAMDSIVTWSIILSLSFPAGSATNGRSSASVSSACPSGGSVMGWRTAAMAVMS